MKSIKEKAKEYGFQNPVIHYDADGNTYDDADKPSMDFEAGANYVLDEIESIIKNVSDEYPRFQQGTIIHGRLIKLLEQLKKQGYEKDYPISTYSIDDGWVQ